MNFNYQQNNNYSKSNSKVNSSSNNNKGIDIDFPTGIKLRSQKKNHKFLPKLFNSILKSKHNKSNKVNNKTVKFDTTDSENTFNHNDSYDDEQTINNNNFSFLKSLNNEETFDDQCTLHSNDSFDNDNGKDPLQAFLSRKTVNMIGRNNDTAPVLDINLAEIIRSRLPNLLQEATTWKLLYSLDQHGSALSTLYNRIHGQGPCIMVLRSSDGEIFGAYLSEAFDPSHQRFFGTPECFLWKACQYQFKMFRATNLNQFFMLADPEFIAMGGGNSNFGFYLDENIQYGYSSTCDTFENEILTKNSKFECYGCEFWGIEF